MISLQAFHTWNCQKRTATACFTVLDHLEKVATLVATLALFPNVTIPNLRWPLQLPTVISNRTKAWNLPIGPYINEMFSWVFDRHSAKGTNGAPIQKVATFVATF